MAVTIESVYKLIEPTTDLHAAWLDARDEWGTGTHQDGSGLHPDDDVDAADGFAAWVERLNAEDPGEGRVPCTYRWIVEGDRVLGAIALRHELNDFLRRVGGHIGYGVRPSARGRGIATWALRQTLIAAEERGLDRVMVTCAVGNTASARTIERCGGVLEEERDTELGRARIYWIRTVDRDAGRSS